MKLTTLSSALLALVLCIGCGGLSDSRELGSLTVEEVRDLCAELVPSTPNPTAEESCTLGALFGTTDQAACEASRDACLETFTPPTPTDCTTVTTMGFEMCVATVGNLRSCGDAASSTFNDVYSRADCALAGTPDAPTSDELTTTSADCDAVSACVAP